jgi:predicted TIM-barrel fold metal-dependent hydrolase
MATRLNARYRVVDADGHVLEPPTGLWERAPAEFKDRMWRIVRDDRGREWRHYDGTVIPAAALAFAGTAGMSREDQDRARRGQLRYTEVRPAAFDPVPRIADLDTDGIDQTVLYPTTLLGVPGLTDHRFAAAVCRAYNEWLADYCRHAPRRLFGVAVVPQQDVDLAVAEIRHAHDLGMVGVFLRPNPSVDGRKLDDPVYDPIWRACAERGLPIGLHPYLLPDMPGACRDFGLGRTAGAPELSVDAKIAGGDFRNVFFTQAISNPVDMMVSLTYLVGGGVLERHPTLKVLFLEANGGWIVPWLERLDHHHEVFHADVPWLRMQPSGYFRRQCWISFDPDESTLAATANSPLVGADRIIWASDYPHPDARFPGVTDELDAATRTLDEPQRARIFGLNAAELYDLPPLNG